jgi:Metallo-beta-lactamase superfamily
MFTVHMLPARQGDCLLIEYGDEVEPHRILVDGGTPGTKGQLGSRLHELGDPVRLELLVVTHIDGDHIGGVVDLLEAEPAVATFGDIWFNAWRHLPKEELEPLGAVQAERLSTWIDEHHAPWNVAFGGAAVAVQPDGAPVTVHLAEGMEVTVLSPGTAELAALRPVWEEEVVAAGLEPGAPYVAPEEVPLELERLGPPTPEEVREWASADSDPDDSEANGASISLLLRYDNRTALLTGDAHAEPLRRGIDALLHGSGDSKLEVDLFKLPHHASQRNVLTSLTDVVRAQTYLISTNGAYYRHPDPEAVARVALIAEGGVLGFNYASRTGPWEDPSLRSEFGYEVSKPEGAEGYLSVDV